MADGPTYDIELTHSFDASVDQVFRAFTEPDDFVQWYGPDGFPVPRETAEFDPRVGGVLRFVMVSEDDPSMRTTFDGRLTDVVRNELLASSGLWHGIPGQESPWESHLRVEFHDESGQTRLVLQEGPHPEGAADFGRQSWGMMFRKLQALFEASTA